MELIILASLIFLIFAILATALVRYYKKGEIEFQKLERDYNLIRKNSFPWVAIGNYEGKKLKLELVSSKGGIIPNSIRVTWGKYFWLEKGISMSSEKLRDILLLLEKREYNEIKKN